MPRQLNKLSALQVSKISKPGLYGDGGGLTLQVTKAGVKSWLFRFMKEGKAYGMGEPPRILRRLLRLRTWSHHEEVTEVPPRVARARRTYGA